MESETSTKAHLKNAEFGFRFFFLDLVFLDILKAVHVNLHVFLSFKKKLFELKANSS